MGLSADLIDFNLIESHKENIQALPQGRSAKALLNAFGSISTPSATRTLNDTIRQEYETELTTINESDDPLDIYVRYVKWTLSAYPSSQATSDSQLRPLLERATKAFQSTQHYKNDPRYLKLWLQYIRLFSDAPRETFAYLAKHEIGNNLALFYEEFAAWLESASRWVQADEVYALGIQREARPVERLQRKHREFQDRLIAQTMDTRGPSSPALPTVRPALVAKIDPFSSATPPNVQQSRGLGSSTSTSKKAKPKMAIFSDANGPPPPPGPLGVDLSKGWNNIGSISDRKKENTVEARPWAGETLKVGKRNAGVQKMAIFKDQSTSTSGNVPTTKAKKFKMSLANGKVENWIVDLKQICPGDAQTGQQYTFEELMARRRGWLDRTWDREAAPKAVASKQHDDLLGTPSSQEAPEREHDHTETRSLNDTTTDLSARTAKPRKKKLVEVKGETVTVKAILDSPTQRKVKRKTTAEPTMTIHTREANNDMMDIFGGSLQAEAIDQHDDRDSESGGDFDDDDYTSGAESTDTGRRSGAPSESGDGSTRNSIMGGDATRTENVSTWSEFTESKHVPKFEDLTGRSEVSHQHRMQMEELELGITEGLKECRLAREEFNEAPLPPNNVAETEPETPVEFPEEAETQGDYLPDPAAEFVAHRNPYRTAEQKSQSRLPFMTPIPEQTESSLGLPTIRAQKYDMYTKTPSRPAQRMISISEDLLGSSPFVEEVKEIAKPAQVKKQVKATFPTKANTKTSKSENEPVIDEIQCNPMDSTVHDQILASRKTLFSEQQGFFDRRQAKLNRAPEIKRFAKAVAKKSSGDKTMTAIPDMPVLNFDGSKYGTLNVVKQLGVGAYAPVYLAQSETDGSTFALKCEDPPSAWEFYVMELTHRRLGLIRAVESIALPHEMHLFADEGYLLESYHDQGTLLNLSNLSKANGGTGVLDEVVCMFFAVELLRTIEAMHSKDLLHGDLKADNCLVRLKPVADSEWSPVYTPSGRDGWSSKGLTLIDFGRGIDMRSFSKDVQFIADWKTTREDCAEMREMRPWTYQIDYWGLAGILHVLLFGKYIEDIVDKTHGSNGEGLGSQKRYKLKEGLKRYWATEHWSAVFDTLLNPTTYAADEENGKMPLTKRMKNLREGMEAWLVENGERKGLKMALKKLEEKIGEKRA